MWPAMGTVIIKYDPEAMMSVLFLGLVLNTYKSQVCRLSHLFLSQFCPDSFCLHFITIYNIFS